MKVTRTPVKMFVHKKIQNWKMEEIKFVNLTISNQISNQTLTHTQKKVFYIIVLYWLYGSEIVI